MSLSDPGARRITPTRRDVVVVCYDIASDARRRRIDRVLGGVGVRVQDSVFECLLSAREVAALRTKLATIMSPPADTVRFYALCRDDRRRARVDGGPPVALDWDYRVV
jgi:CRISPR-associated protein Cas2